MLPRFDVTDQLVHSFIRSFILPVADVAEM